MSLIHICRATRGKYVKPIPIFGSEINWVDDNYNTTTAPEKHSCEHPKHWEWGNGTRNGQKLYYPLKEMFLQKYHLTKKELHEAVKQYDMASIEMKGRIICKNCADHEQ